MAIAGCEAAVFDYGKFGWIMDPEGNKIELWEPVYRVFDEMNPDAGKTDG
jgi:hypothetical protein